MPRLYNVKHQYPADAVYVGRGTPFGNPYVIGRDGDRDEVCDLFEDYCAAHPELIDRIKKELRGENLLCHCDPLRCHGQTLLRIANDQDDWM